MRSGEASVNVAGRGACDRFVSGRRLTSTTPGMTKNTATLPSSSPVNKRDVCVFSQMPKKVRLKSIASGSAARIKRLRGGVDLFLNDRTSGYSNNVNAK